MLVPDFTRREVFEFIRDEANNIATVTEDTLWQHLWLAFMPRTGSDHERLAFEEFKSFLNHQRFSAVKGPEGLWRLERVNLDEAVAS